MTFQDVKAVDASVKDRIYEIIILDKTADKLVSVFKSLDNALYFLEKQKDKSKVYGIRLKIGGILQYINALDEPIYGLRDDVMGLFTNKFTSVPSLFYCT